MVGLGFSEIFIILLKVLYYVGISLILVYVILQIRQIARSVNRIEEQLLEIHESKE
jgi:hypothetical protein